MAASSVALQVSEAPGDARATLSVAWLDVGYTVPRRRAGPAASGAPAGPAEGARRAVLRGVTGWNGPGDVLAVLGSSGAGKTTFLNVLAARVVDARHVEGSVRYNGAPRPTDVGARNVGYVKQDGLMMETLTPRELIAFSALLRSPNGGDTASVVDAILEKTQLTKCADTIVGNVEHGGISGGERKRVAVACELVTDPMLLYVDEPTSGLDAYTALSVVEELRQIANEKRNVITTIHQPSSEIFDCFDRLLLLHEGRTAYLGPAADVLGYLAALGKVAPAHHNPADFAVAVLQRSHFGKDPPIDFDGVFAAHPLAAEARAGATRDASEFAAATADVSSTGFAAPFRVQCRAVLNRAFVNFRRSPILMRARAGQTVFFGLLVALVFRDIGNRTTPQSHQDRAGMLFFASVNNMLLPFMASTLTFPIEKMIMKAEVSSGYYSATAYALAKSAAEAPFQLFFPVVFSCLVYFAAGLREEASAFLVFTFVLICVCFASQSWGLMIGALAPTPEIALIGGLPVVIPFIIAGGLFANRERFEPELLWLEKLSIISWSFEGLMHNEYDSRDFPPGGDVRHGSEVLSRMSIGGSTARAILALLVETIVARAVMWYALVRASRRG